MATPFGGPNNGRPNVKKPYAPRGPGQPLPPGTPNASHGVYPNGPGIPSGVVPTKPPQQVKGPPANLADALRAKLGAKAKGMGDYNLTHIHGVPIAALAQRHGAQKFSQGNFNSLDRNNPAAVNRQNAPKGVAAPWTLKAKTYPAPSAASLRDKLKKKKQQASSGGAVIANPLTSAELAALPASDTRRQ